MSYTQYKDQEYLVQLGLHIQSLRLSSGKPHDEFLHLCGLDRRQLRRIEKAETNTSISLLKKIADGLNLTMSELLNF